MRLLRIQEVIRVTGLSRMTIYRYEKNGEFPKRRRIGMNSVRWLDQDIDGQRCRPRAGR
jgi:prophage regulatory protein